MAAVSLFWDTNMAAVTSCENTLYSAARRIFNSLLGVSSGDETLHLMFDILRERALSPVLENFRRAFSPGPTDRPWVSEDGFANELPYDIYYGESLVFFRTFMIGKI